MTKVLAYGDIESALFVADEADDHCLISSHRAALKTLAAETRRLLRQEEEIVGSYSATERDLQQLRKRVDCLERSAPLVRAARILRSSRLPVPRSS
jgi:hypothetical protein